VPRFSPGLADRRTLNRRGGGERIVGGPIRAGRGAHVCWEDENVVNTLDAVVAVVVDPSGSVTHWSPTAELLWGLTPGDAVSRPAASLLADRRLAGRVIGRVAAGGSWRGEVVLARPDGTPLRGRLSAHPLVVSDGQVYALILVSPVPPGADTVPAPGRRAARGRRRPDYLADATAVLNSSLDADATADAVVRLVVPELADLAGVFLFEGSALRRVAVAHRDPAVETRLWADPDGPSSEAMRRIVGQAVFGYRGAVLNETDGGVDGPGGPDVPRLDDDAPVGASLVVPLVAPDVLGALVLVRSDEVPFDPADQGLVEEFGLRAAAAIENALLHGRLQEAERTESFLLEAAKTLATATGYVETLDRLAALALPRLGDLCLIDVSAEDGSIVRLVTRHAEASKQPLADRLRWQYPPDPDGNHPSVEVIRHGETQWGNDMAPEFWAATSRGEDHLRLMTSLGFTSYMAIPLRAAGEVLGSLTLVGTSRRFVPADRALAEELAGHVANVLVKARRYEEEHRTAHVLQTSLLPERVPSVPGLSMAVRYQPGTSGLEVGGDFYDATVLPGGQLWLMIGDVAGHDRGAVAIMGQLRSAARALAAQSGDPRRLVESLQRSWDLLGFGRIATATFCRLDPADGELAIASAGHPPPLVVAGGRARYLSVKPSTPLGVPAEPAPAWRGRLDPGSILVLYTDGAIEQRGTELDAGMARLADLAVSVPPDPEALCQRVVEALPAEREDDVALLAVRFG